MLGSAVAEPVCDIAVSLGPHNNVDRIATADGATKPDDNFMTCPSKFGTEMSPRQVQGTVHSELRHRRLQRYLTMTRRRHGEENAERSLKAGAIYLLALFGHEQSGR